MFRLPLMTSLLLASAAVLAQDHAGVEPSLLNADANGDGSVTREEFVQAREKLFATLDRNGDGVVTADELPERANGRRADPLARLDKNGDGRASKDEFTSAPTRGFDRADKDGNGVLDAKELEAAKENARDLAQRLRERRAQ